MIMLPAQTVHLWSSAGVRLRSQNRHPSPPPLPHTAVPRELVRNHQKFSRKFLAGLGGLRAAVDDWPEKVEG